MKKKLAIILGGIMIAVLCIACGNEDNSANKEKMESGTEKQKESAAKQDEKKKNIAKKEITLEINGQEYVFPMSYEKFKSYGWTYYIPEDDDVTQWPTVLEPGQSIGDLYYDNGDIKALEFFAYNPTEEDITLDKAEIIGFRVEYDQTIAGESAEKYMNIPAGSIILNGKAEIGKAVKKDVYDYVGEDSVHEENPDINYENSDVFLYYLDENQQADKCMTVTFDQNGVFYEMSYTCAE